MNTTPQQRMRSALERVGLPHRQIKVFGGQIIITSASRATAEKWAGVLAQFARVQRVLQSTDYAQANRKTTLNPSTVPVWRTYARID